MALRLSVDDRDSGFRKVDIEMPDALTNPEEFATAVKAIDLSGERPVLIHGRAPIWGYAMLIHAAHATPAIGVFEPRQNGYVIVASHDSNFELGQVIEASRV